MRAGSIYIEGAGSIGKAQDRVRVGDIEIIAHQCHAEWRVEPAQEYAPDLGNPILISVAQDGDAVGARDGGSRLLHEQPHEESLYPLAVFRSRGRTALGDQHVAIGQDMQPARMVQPIGEEIDDQSGRGARLAARWPTPSRCNFDRGDQRLARGGKRGGRPEARLQGKLSPIAAGCGAE